MLTLNIRWKALFQIVCSFKGHEWQEYAVIHAAWNYPGKYCTRCKKSIIRRQSWTVEDHKAVMTDQTEEVQPWFSLTKS